MNQIREIIDALLSFRFADLTALLDSVIKNPLANLQASLLVLAAVVVLTLLAIVAAIMFLGFSDDDDEEEEEDEPVREKRPVRTAATPSARQVEPAVPLTPQQRRVRRAQSFLVGTVAVIAVWLLMGVTTGSDVMCLSCHAEDSPHVVREDAKSREDSGQDEEETASDPHVSTACVRCHEPGGVATGLTISVPSRVTHFVKGMTTPRAAKRYGVPVASSSCSSCHTGLSDRTVTVQARGVRVSHKEPLDAGATCVDCHEMQVRSGAVGAWTVGMGACLRCHDNKTASAECTSCHTRDIAYAVHVNREPEPKRLVTQKRCYTCHEQRACDSCHGLSMPHTESFKTSEHPRVATLDNWYNQGRTCKRCHTATRNPCNKCHNKGDFPGHPVNVWPKIHGVRPEAGFDACDSCHGNMATIEGRNFCGVCHEQYARQFK